jgi:hypothetical protein
LPTEEPLERGSPAIVRVGTSFSSHRAAYLGLEPRSAFQRVLELGFRLLRISAYWSDIAASGYGELDWQMEQAARAGQPVLLTVGMKAIQYPEFYIPPALVPAAPGRGGRIGDDPVLREAVLRFVRNTVERYVGQSMLVAWQVENEPFNRAGPPRWWVDPALVDQEIAAVRDLDGRPIVVNTFAHFNLLVDWSSRPHRGLFDLVGIVPERQALEALAALGPSGVLGMDAYTRIGISFLGWEFVRKAAPDWADRCRLWLETARAEGHEAWIIESQAEPWEPSLRTYDRPRTFDPASTVEMYQRLVEAGFRTLLLWGCEYWLWRADAGDSRWLQAARDILAGAGQR